jgi:signal transduction histidine kinase/putative methionine-R-sulfoxide reductase with GAF domain
MSLRVDAWPNRAGGNRELDPLAGALLALRSTQDVATACAIAASCAARALGAAEHRLLRLDPRSGALRLVDEAGVETPYLAEEGGPVEHVLRAEAAFYDAGGPSAGGREALLWKAPPAAIAALPLEDSHHLFGCLLVAFEEPRSFDDPERALLQSVADAVAMALHRAELQRLLDEERARRVELERRRSAGEQTSSSLMGLVAHEIRTPLTAIKAYTETLLDTLADPQAPRERFLGIIHDECDRLSRLVTDILDLSRLESGQRPLRLQKVEVGALVGEVIQSLAPLARVRRIEVRVELDRSLVVESDSDLLRRFFVNLISNAIQFAAPSGQVLVLATVQQEECTGAVEDDGPGIAPEDLPHLFDRFFRGTQPEGKDVEGTGLGLAIARGIVEIHGGRLWAESAPGQGSRFCFAFPLRQVASPSARRITRAIVGRDDLRELLDRAVEMVASTMDANLVSLMLVDPERGDLFVASARGLDPHRLPVRRTSVRAGVAGSIAAWGRPVLVDNIETDRRFRRLNHPQYNTKSLLCVPLHVEREVVGVINVNNKSSAEVFDENDLALLVVLVERVGSAIERSYAYPDSGRIAEEATEALRSITRLKREGLLGDRDMVGLARAMARAIGMSETDVDLVGYVAAVRDLGMASLVPELRDRPGTLGEDEREALRKHPERSVELIRPLEYLGSVRELVLAHHERWDGAGYPHLLRGTEIPLGARILAVVDAYASMTAGRPYRAARSHEEALAELRQESGRQFDPEVVEALVRVLGERTVG